jgi:hypothetical protein
MEKVKQVNIHVCDFCRVEISLIVKCDVCRRECCPYHYSPTSEYTNPVWFPLYMYLCNECAGSSEMKIICGYLDQIKIIASSLHFRMVGDEMGKLTEKG